MQSSHTTSFLIVGILALIVGAVIGYLYASGVSYQKGYDQGMADGRSTATAVAAPPAAGAGDANAGANPFAPPAAVNPFQQVKLNPFVQ